MKSCHSHSPAFRAVSFCWFLLAAALLLPAIAAGAVHCLSPRAGDEITEVDCRAAALDPRCTPECQLPPCPGYEVDVRPFAAFRWRRVPGAVHYRIRVQSRITGDQLLTEIGPDHYVTDTNVCSTVSPVSAFLPEMTAPALESQSEELPGSVAADLGLPARRQTVPMIGEFEWSLEVRNDEEWTSLGSDWFVYLHNPNPFGTAAIEFRWQPAAGTGNCAETGQPVDFWIHLPLEYPDNRPHRSGYEWGYALIQSTSDLLGSAPALGTDYTVEELPIPDGPAHSNWRIWLRNRLPNPSSRLAYQLVFTLDSPLDQIEWDMASEFDLGGTDMPKSRDIWPVELVQAGYLDPGPHTAPFQEILDSYVWCDPYPRCCLCPWTNSRGYCCACWAGQSPDFCLPAEPVDVDPGDRSTWRGHNVLAWFRDNRVFDPDVPWSIDENVRALDRVMSRWPFLFFGDMLPWMEHYGAYLMNDVIRLFDRNSGMAVRDHWRFTDSSPMGYYETGLGASNASTHFGLSLARMFNFPARAVCLAHYHNDIEIWLPHGPPAGARYLLDEGEWVRFLGENFVRTRGTDPAGGLISASLTGIFKTTLYIGWDAEDSIPFNWFLSGTEPEYDTCWAQLTVLQWPEKRRRLALPDEATRLIAVWPADKDFSAGEGFAALRSLGGSPALGAWYIAQHLIPLGPDRYGFVRRLDPGFEFVVVDAGISPVQRVAMMPAGTVTVVEPGRYSLTANISQSGAYLFLELTEFEVAWATPTPTPSLTPTSTSTPTPSPSPSPSPSPTATRTPTPSPLPTPPPTPTIPPLGIRLLLPQTMFRAGDAFFLDALLSNPGEPLPRIRLAVALAAFGSHYFWPSWSEFDPGTGAGSDSLLLDLARGSETRHIIPAVAWPDGVLPMAGLHFYGALLDDELTTLIAELADVEWGCR